ncbi:hypothetical protein EIP91_007028 [Steccherinum ochraceum]|uniref:Uncharacterized protein n=1 Tax=Steccherinum ochraceum TaxID=92696 RepID=A0A4R0RT92_9APHY|nr:hypothetical protein EIP91_007028 [Steccherinum ochraceum]
MFNDVSPMVPSRVITFPRPPPTCNTLSASERSKLLKSTAKLGNVLGSTPHVVDEAFDLPPSPPQSAVAKKLRQRTWSFKTKKDHSDTSESDSDISPIPRTSTSSRASSSSASSSGCPSAPSSPEGAWRSRFPAQRPPLLRLGMGKMLSKSSRRMQQPTLESIPGSPPPTVENTPSSPEDVLYATFEKDDPFGAYANSSYLELAPEAPIPQFTIPSDAALRRQKMRRLKRKLGDNIPVHLVFPPIMESDEEDVIIHSPTTPTCESPDSDGSCDSSSNLITDSEREQEDVLPPLPYDPRSFRTKHHSRLRHEAMHQPARRSRFADSAKPLPPVPPLPSTRTIRRRSGQFIIHYECTDEYTAETFDGIRAAVSGPVDTRIGYAI